MDWKKIPKIDAHVHILPEERRQGFIQYQGENCAWAKADLNQYMDYMDEYNIKKAILHPTNDPYMYYSTRKTNRILRMFGPDRLIFGTDYPEKAYEEYCGILNEMDFTGEEIKKIAY